MVVQTYAGYTRCDHCGIYDRDPHWCDLCQMPKDRNVSSGQTEPRSDLAKLRRQPRPEASDRGVLTGAPHHSKVGRNGSRT